MSETIRITGGCQCGAVRYAIHAPPTGPHICHCRMCQKAFGSFFAPLVGVKLAAFELTRGAPSIFRSSDEVERGFCSRCGTPLTFHYVGKGHVSIAIGSLDEPAKMQPREQFGIEARMPWFGFLPALPGDKTTEEDGGELIDRIAASNHQHPDRDTAVWPPDKGR